MAKIICFDFDGVIHSYTTPWSDPAVIPDPIVPGALEAILAYLNAGYEVAVLSSRSSYRRGRRAMMDWLIDQLADHKEKHGGTFEPGYVVHSLISWPTSKPPAILTIDDRAHCFKGTFPTLDEIKNFKPWNKQ